MSAIDGGHYGYGMVRRTKRLWTDEEKRSICFQTAAPGVAAAAMTARMKLPDVEEEDKPKRRPIPDHVPRVEVDLTPSTDACADCAGRLRRIGEDVAEELECVQRLC